MRWMLLVVALFVGAFADTAQAAAVARTDGLAAKVPIERAP